MILVFGDRIMETVVQVTTIRSQNKCVSNKVIISSQEHPHLGLNDFSYTVRHNRTTIRVQYVLIVDRTLMMHINNFT